MTFETVAAEANALGLLVNNCFQRYDGLWQANLRAHPEYAEFGSGLTPTEALRAALEKVPESILKEAARMKTQREAARARAAALEDLF